MPRRREAIRRAVSLERKHAADDSTFPNDNPSSGGYRLLRSAVTSGAG
jgi:hypothetical protein